MICIRYFHDFSAKTAHFYGNGAQYRVCLIHEGERMFPLTVSMGLPVFAPLCNMTFHTGYPTVVASYLFSYSSRPESETSEVFTISLCVMQ